MEQVPGKDVYYGMRAGVGGAMGGASNITHYKSNSRDSNSSRGSRDSSYSQDTQVGGCGQ